MAPTALATRTPDHTATAETTLTVGPFTKAQLTPSAFTRQPRHLTTGDTIRAMINGTMRELTITRVTHWQITTDDWRTWWNEQEGRAWGDSIHGNRNYLIG